MKRFYFDSHYLIALILAPIVWAVLYFWQAPVTSRFDAKLFLMVCAVYPVLEELAFRGFIQSWLLEKPVFARKPFAGISFANLATSAVFATVHLYSQPLLWAVSVFFPSLVFGYFRDRFGGVVPSIILHCWYNAGFFLLLK